MRSRVIFAGIAAALACFSTASLGEDLDPLKIPDTQLEPLAWSELNGWAADDHIAAFATYRKSCAPFLAARRPRDQRPMYGALWEMCRQASDLRPTDDAEARAFFEENFRPVAISRLGESTGLLTGYYEPIVEGSRIPNPEFYTPIYRRPSDLLVNGRSVGAGEFPNRAAVTRLNSEGKTEPYYDRAAIEDGALDGQRLEICYLKDPWDAFSIQIQGSARVRLEDGTMVRINYDGHNGRPYTAIGSVLIQRYGVPREQISMERIHQWMLANPTEARKVRQINQAFVFFRVAGLSDATEARGAQGVPLTPGRSIAVDRTHVYGTPFFIDATLPIASDRPTTSFRRLMVAQDTGSAIQGPARADLFWGAGDLAGQIAGRIKQQGRFTVLLPRSLDMVEIGKQMPLPLPRPGTPAAAPLSPPAENQPAAKQPAAKQPVGKKQTPPSAKPHANATQSAAGSRLVANQ